MNEFGSLSLYPPFIQHRIEMFDRLKAQIVPGVSRQIIVKLPDAREIKAESFKTTPMEIAISIAKSLAERIVIAKVDGHLFDLSRPLETDCSLQFLDFDDEEGKKVFWHSSAHVLGEACELEFNCHLCIGPPIEEGFFYELDIPLDETDESQKKRVVLETDYPQIHDRCKKAISEKQKFERLVLTKEDLLEMFKVF
jgi:threonyl-tRNA synthetase